MPSRICIAEEYRVHHEYTCKPCRNKFPKKTGFEFSKNCGLDDDGRPVHDPYRQCKDGTFNDGSDFECQKCSSCPSLELTASSCTAESDVVCCEGEQVLNGRCIDQSVKTTVIPTVKREPSRTDATSVSVTDPSSTIIPSFISDGHHITVPHDIPNPAIYVCVGIFSVLALLCLLLILRRWSKHFSQGRNNRMFLSSTEQSCNGEIKEILENSINQTAIYRKINENSEIDCVLNVTNSHNNQLAHEIHAAPLNTVLNNLDVLEELVLLLDPDISGAKSTRHLAAQCSFTFTWINYAYSMKDHKSPLVAVLEGVVAKNPDWTVGHFAGLLSGIGRNDAVETLAKLAIVEG